MLRTFLVLICLTTCWAAKAQQVALRIYNGSFEEFEVNNGFLPNILDYETPFIGDTLNYWFGRSVVGIIQDGNCFDNDFIWRSPDTVIKPVDGKFFLLFGAAKYPFTSEYRVGAIGQKLKCPLIAGVKYKMSLYATTDTISGTQIIDNSDQSCTITPVYNEDTPTLSIMLGNIDLIYQFKDWYAPNPPTYQFVLNQAPLLIKQWKKYEVEFTPVEDFDVVALVNIRLPCLDCQVFDRLVKIFNLIVDAVSDIYYAEPTYILPTVDTLESGSCYTFSPNNIHPYTTSHRWAILGDSIFSTEATPTVCPTVTTTYVVLSNDNCGWAESDTITIVVKPKLEPPAIPEDFFNAYANNAFANQLLNINSSQSGILFLFDAAGRLIGSFQFPKGDSTLPLQLAAGVYMFDAKLANGQNKNGKVIMIK